MSVRRPRASSLRWIRPGWMLGLVCVAGAHALAEPAPEVVGGEQIGPLTTTTPGTGDPEGAAPAQSAGAVPSPHRDAPAGIEPGSTADARLGEVGERVRAAAHAAAEAGLPAEWIVDKVAEGLAKGVPPGRILSAVEALGKRMRRASRIQRGLPPPRSPAQARAILRALLDASAVGAPDAAMAQLAGGLARSNPEAVQAGLSAVADLGERGFRGEPAVRAVEVAFERDGREGIRALLRAADHIGAGNPTARLEALTAAARRASDRATPSPGAALSHSRGASVRPVGPSRNRGSARGVPSAAGSRGRGRK